MATVKRKGLVSQREAEELADYIEKLRPQDLGQGRPGPGYRGRPSLTAKATHSPSIHVRLPEPLYAKLSRRADASGRTISNLVREILEIEIESR